MATVVAAIFFTGKNFAQIKRCFLQLLPDLPVQELR